MTDNKRTKNDLLLIVALNCLLWLDEILLIIYLS